MNLYKKIFIQAIPLVIIFVLLAMYLPHTVASTQVGVRVKKISLFDSKGIENRGYSPGTYFFLPFFNEWHTFDTTLKILQMSVDARSSNIRIKDDLIFKTIDGNDISLDMILTYRIDPNKAPYILSYVASSDEEIKNTIVRLVARSKPRDIFGELKTEDFYQSVKRSEKAKQVKQTLNKLLIPYGIIIEAVKTKDYRFNRAYAKAIKDRKVADQKTQRYISETKAAEEEYKKKLEDANGSVSEMIAKVDGKYNQVRLAANAYYKAKEMEAKAIELEGKAEAESIKKMNKALSGAGGMAKVKLEIAKSLRKKKILLLPCSPGSFDIKSTNVNRLLDTYAIKSLSEHSSASQS